MSTGSTKKPQSAAHHRFHFLDALRGIAAAAVISWHLPSYLGARNAVHSSFLAVDFFFCLSGFVIAFSYEKRLEAGLRLRDFTVIRLIRLYPVYWLGTILGFLSFVFIDPGLHIAVHLKMRLLALVSLSFFVLPSFHLVNSDYLFPLDFTAWSLFFELLVNVAFAWLIAKRFASNWFLAFLASLSLALLIIWIERGGAFDLGWSPSASHLGVGVARVILSFTIGILLLRLFRRWPRPKVQGWLLPMIVTSFVILVLISPFPFMQTDPFHLFAATLLFPLVVYFGAQATTSASLTKMCVVLGELSYPLYILQGIFLLSLKTNACRHFFLRHAPLENEILAVFIAFVMLISYGVAKCLDEPLRKYLSKRYLALSNPPDGKADLSLPPTSHPQQIPLSPTP